VTGTGVRYGHIDSANGAGGQWWRVKSLGFTGAGVVGGGEGMPGAESSEGASLEGVAAQLAGVLEDRALVLTGTRDP
jgi:hypothetical protein